MIATLQQNQSSEPFSSDDAGLTDRPILPQGFRRYHLTEMGNAERLLDMHRGHVLWCKSFGYIVWDGKRWQLNDEVTVERWAKQTVKAIYRDAAKLLEVASACLDEEQSKALSQEAGRLNEWARRSENAHMIESMLKLARSDVQVSPDIFDTHPFLFNCQNGTLDIQTGQFREHQQLDYLTKISPFAYKKDAICPKFLNFLQEVMLNREELIVYMQKALGYCLTGDTSEKAFFLLIGSGDNGKSVLIETIGSVLGPDYASVMSDKTITASNSRDGGAASPDIADLRGLRMAWVSETEENARLATQLIKRMSGQDSEKARFLHRDPFTFTYTHKVFMYTNHEPTVRESGHAFWVRVKRIPFDFRCPEERKDKTLAARLKKEESEGILAWLVEGARMWRLQGLTDISVVAEATQKYREDQDVVGQFMRDFCVVNSTSRVSTIRVLTRFNTWLKDEMGMQPFAMPTLIRLLGEHGIKKQHAMKGNMFLGMALLENVEFVSFNIVGKEEPVNLIPPGHVQTYEGPDGKVFNPPSEQAASPPNGPALLTPDTVQNYPIDVIAWMKAQGIREPKRCLDPLHTWKKWTPFYRPDKNAWEYQCDLCFPALSSTRGKYRFYSEIPDSEIQRLEDERISEPDTPNIHNGHHLAPVQVQVGGILNPDDIPDTL